MGLESINSFLKETRIVDLSKKVTPGKAAGPFETRNRRYEIEPFTYPPGELMHYIEMESHISTHVEAPNHSLHRGMEESQKMSASWRWISSLV